MKVNIHSILSKSGDVFVLNLTSEEVFTNSVLADILNEISNNIRGQDVSKDIDRTDSGYGNGESIPELSISEDIRDANETGSADTFESNPLKSGAV